MNRYKDKSWLSRKIDELDLQLSSFDRKINQTLYLESLIQKKIRIDQEILKSYKTLNRDYRILKKKSKEILNSLLKDITLDSYRSPEFIEIINDSEELVKMIHLFEEKLKILDRSFLEISKDLYDPKI